MHIWCAWVRGRLFQEPHRSDWQSLGLTPAPIPQVTRDFTGEVTIALAESSTAEAKSQAIEESRKRQRAWISRVPLGAGARKRPKWRPRKRFRLSSSLNLQYVDHQLRTSGLPPLAAYKFDLSTAGHWRDWPLLTLVWDQEASNMTAGHWLLYDQSCNVDIQFDPSHGAWNDVRGAARDAGFLGLLMGCLLTWNIPHGPWDDDVRASQVAQMIRDMGSAQAGVPPLFAARAHDIIAESGRQSLLPDKDLLETLLLEFLTENPFGRKRSKICLNRFMSLVGEGRRETTIWSLRRTAYELIALELDLLTSRSFENVLVKASSTAQAGANDEAPDKSTDSKRMDPVDQAVRKGMANSLVVGVYILSGPLNRRRLNIFLEASVPIEQWHIKQSRELRSAQESKEWTMRQVAEGRCMAHITVLWSMLTFASSLRKQGFWLGSSDDLTPDPVQVEVDTMLAEESAALCMAMLFKRINRTLPLTLGWPNSTARFLSEPAIANPEAQRLLGEYDDYQRLVAAAASNPKAKELSERSIFRRTCVLQLVRALQESGGVITDELRCHLDRFMRRAMSTTAIEEGFNSMKNDAVLKRQAKLSRPERALATVLHREVLSQRHRYRELPRTSASVRKAAQAPAHFFKASAKEGSLDFGAVMGTSSTPSWWSPNADRYSAPIADLFLVSQALRDGSLDDLSDSWLGGMLRWDHKLVVKHSGGRWHFALGPIADSAVLLWPCEQRTVSDSDASDPLRYFEPLAPLGKPIFAKVCRLSEWVATTVDFRPPAWLASHYAGAGWPKRILAVQAAEPEALLTVAAKAGFWDLSLPFLQGLGKHLGCEQAGSGADLSSCVYGLVSHVLGNIGEEKILDICSRRVASMSRRARNQVVSEVLEYDDCNQFLDKDDIKTLRQEADSVKSKAHQLSEYQADIVKKRQGLRGGVSGKSSSSAGGGSRASPRQRVPMTGDIAQVVAKQLMPEGGFIWRSLSSSAWLGRFPPMGEHSRSWRKWGERGACLEVLRAVWRDWCAFTGSTEDTVPIDGLFNDIDGSTAAQAILDEGSATGASSSRAAAQTSAPKARARAKPKATVAPASGPTGVKKSRKRQA